MTTIAAAHTKAVFPLIKPHRPSAVLSGIVPDQAHLDDGGYHVSIDDLKRYGNTGDYSNTRSLDVSPPVTATGRLNACAIDVSMSVADMVATYKAVELVFNNRATDTRAKYLNAINVWSGKAGVAPVRFNFQQGTKTRASKDHEWHGHGDWPRVYVDQGYNRTSAERAARAMASVWNGQTHDGWLRQERLGPYAPKPTPPPVPAKPVTPTPPKPAPAPAEIRREEDESMITSTHQVPAQWAYAADGKALPDALAATLSLPLSPAGSKTHRWGKDYRLFLSLAADNVTTGTRVRVAIHDGSAWVTNTYTVVPGARVSVTVPAPKKDTAYNVTVGRVQPEVAKDAPVPLPTGSIGLLVEMLHN